MLVKDLRKATELIESRAQVLEELQMLKYHNIDRISLGSTRSGLGSASISIPENKKLGKNLLEEIKSLKQNQLEDINAELRKIGVTAE